MSDRIERLRKRARNLCQLAAYEPDTFKRLELVHRAAKLKRDADAAEAEALGPAP